MENQIKKLKHLHFSGIKGVGMTALALYAQDLGITVTGSDVKAEFITQNILNQRKIKITSGFSAAALPAAAQALIYTAARPDNPQIAEARRRGIEAISYAQALSRMTDDKKTVAVCGVGGKTTTTAMLAVILEKAGLHPSFIDGVGNIIDLRVPGKYSPLGKYAVVEADDYASLPGVDNRPKFHYLSPQLIVVTNISYDHPDIYRNIQQTKKAFYDFFLKIPADGFLIANLDCPNTRELCQRLKTEKPEVGVITYGFSDGADWKIKKTSMKNRLTSCQIEIGRNIDLQFNILLPGKHNCANACAALAAASQLGVSQTQAVKYLEAFRGTLRRFQKIGTYRNVEVWDDYAHHPYEIEHTLAAARQWFPDKNLRIIFQPHTYSRTKALLPEFARALSLADEVIITEIYASAREKKSASFDVLKLCQQIAKLTKNVKFITYAKVVDYLKNTIRDNQIIMTIGAGNVYELGYQLTGKYGS